MTNEELRQLDADVHREIAGRDCRLVTEHFGANSPKELRDRDDSYAVPRYSADMGAAWWVVQWLQSKGFCIRLSNKQFDWCWWCYVYHGVDETKAEAIVQEMTAPLAICLAALKSVRGPKA